jgi:hypothetical protein
MKKKITLIALSTILSFNTFAQDYQKSIGARLGLSNGVTYKQFISPHNAIEVVGSALFMSGSALTGNSIYAGLSGEYLWSWNMGVEGFSWFVGPGVSVGMWTGAYSGFNVAINGMVGLEYKFAPIPLALSADVNPHFYLLNSVGISPLVGALSLRYTF